MASTHTPRLAVASGTRLVGMLSQTDILRYLAIRVDLDEEEAASARPVPHHGGRFAEMQ